MNANGREANFSAQITAMKALHEALADCKAAFS
jgi:hypothetical protein